MIIKRTLWPLFQKRYSWNTTKGKSIFITSLELQYAQVKYLTANKIPMPICHQKYRLHSKLLTSTYYYRSALPRRNRSYGLCGCKKKPNLPLRANRVILSLSIFECAIKNNPLQKCFKQLVLNMVQICLIITQIFLTILYWKFHKIFRFVKIFFLVRQRKYF